MATYRIVSRCIRSRSVIDKVLPLCSLATKRHTVQFKDVQRNLSSTTSADEHILSSPLKDLEIPDVPFAEFMLSRYKQFGNLTAIVDSASGKRMSFTELREAIIKVASGLTRMGIRKGDRVLIFATNCPEYLVLFLACAAIGAPVSTANPTFTAGELKRQLENVKCCTIVTMPGFVPTVKEAVASSSQLKPQVKSIIVLGESEGCVPSKKLFEDDGKAFPENIDIHRDDLLIIPYSSGTTGLPKGVMLSNRNCVVSMLQFAVLMYMETATDSMLGVLPVFHFFGMAASLLGATGQGAAYVNLPGFEPESFLRAIQEYKITRLHLVPPLALFMARHPLADNYDLSSVKTIALAAAPIGSELCTELEGKFGLQVYQGYGLTEMSPIVSVDLPPYNPATVGYLGPSTQGKIVDPETKKSLPLGESGEICARGPQVMLGYLDNQQATDDMIRDGWLHTGDIGYFREDGRLVVKDRLKELVKYKAFQVAPAELEALLLSHPAVQDVAVTGVPDERAGELPKAFVVLKPDFKATQEQIKDFVKENVSSHKQLRGGVQFVEQIPKSPSGKILRRLLKVP